MLGILKKAIFVGVLFSTVSLFAEDMTLQELAKYDGKNGNKAYIAVDGIIYDVSSSFAWQQGEHAGIKAGSDLSQAIIKAPHGKSKLSQLPVVGKLIK